MQVNKIVYGFLMVNLYTDQRKMHIWYVNMLLKTVPA